MKKITLYGATTRNDGSYVDAGATLAIGDGTDEISAERAKDLTDRSIAVSETAAKADEKAGDTVIVDIKAGDAAAGITKANA